MFESCLGRRQVVVSVLLLMTLTAVNSTSGQETRDASVEQERLETMRSHIVEITFRGKEPGFPVKLVDQPLFRYDDLTRGYVDGTVWRLGASGRPKAIVTTELHPRYAGEPRIICDYLSMTDIPFTAKVSEGAIWSPSGSAVTMNDLPDCPALAATKSQRLFQLKKVAERFTGHQTVEGQELELRLLPTPIDRYSPTESDTSDAAIFLFVSGRNPGIVLMIEASDSGWQFGVGRLSGPSSLYVNLDGNSVWSVSPSDYGMNSPYTAANYPIDVPGYDRRPVLQIDGNN